MPQRPTVLSLTICEKVIVEAGTQNITLVSCFRGLRVDGFPSPPQRFCLFAVLTNGHGEVIIDWHLERLDALTTVKTYQTTVRFTDRLQEIPVSVRLTKLSFPAAGWYQFTMFLNGEPAARRLLHVYGAEETA
jgi:hypothetical protein